MSGKGQIPDAPKIGAIEIPQAEGLHQVQLPETAELLDVILVGSKVYIVGLYDPGGQKNQKDVRVAGNGDTLPATHCYTYVGNFVPTSGPPRLVFVAHSL